MHLKGQTLDDLLRRILVHLLAKSSHRVTSTRGVNLERTGVLLTLTNPRARLSRTFRRSQIFSCLGELTWYLAQSDSLPFIRYYIRAYDNESDDRKIVPAAYGPRLFSYRGINQLARVTDLLRDHRSSRRAVVQIIDITDLSTRHIPCTCTLQFFVRGNRLSMMTSMRSNDAYLGLPHDIFAFTMIQEMIARELGVELGWYKHAVGSMHLYENKVSHAQAYVNDGLHQTEAMPPMPLGSQAEQIKELIRIESRIRRKKRVDLERTSLSDYWLDLARLLRIYRFFLDKDTRGMQRQMDKLSTKYYDQYVELKQKSLAAALADVPEQRVLFSTPNTESDRTNRWGNDA